MTYLYHPDGMEPPARCVFVFGSNLAGIHGAGAAKFALEKRDAEWGNGRGRTVLTYAIPTKDERIQTLPLGRIKFYVSDFLEHARQHPTTRFFVTRVGCGLAGYTDDDIAPLFKGAPTNCWFPVDWRSYLDEEEALA